jgi:hypothetical protein
MEEIYVTEGNDSVKDTPWVVSGFDRIDKLAGGIRRGEMNIFVAKSREPKTQLGALMPNKIFYYDPDACLSMSETARAETKSMYAAMAEWVDKLREQAMKLNTPFILSQQGGTGKSLLPMLYSGQKHYSKTYPTLFMEAFERENKPKPVDHLQAIRDIVGAGL